VAAVAILLVMGANGWLPGRADLAPRERRTAGERGTRRTQSFGPGDSAKGRGGSQPRFQPRKFMDTSGFAAVLEFLPEWSPDASLEEIRKIWQGIGHRGVQEIDRRLKGRLEPAGSRVALLLEKAMFLNYEGDAQRASEALAEARSFVGRDDALAADALYTIIYYQGISAMRRGETENCVKCRGDSACLLPLAPAAVHADPTGSRLAIGHFTEYLERFPDDVEVRWLLNLAHMTVGEHPERVDPRFVISLGHFQASEFDIGQFRDIGHLAGVDRLNQAGGAIMEDFDNDGLLDIVVTAVDATESMALYRNKGDGTFEDLTEAAGLDGQLGGMVCYQADYNNDGQMDIFIPRGAWLPRPIRPSLLRNEGKGRFRDVTRAAGLATPVNSISASWADYDNDGWVDLFVGCEIQPQRLYHNRRDGTFEEVAARAGVQGDQRAMCKGSTWLDFDNDGYPDLFLDFLNAPPLLYRNQRDGTFCDVTSAMGIDGPVQGFSCWAWDYDNDGWLDIFATCYDRSVRDVVQGLLGQPHGRQSNRLFHNISGKAFKNVTAESGLDLVFATMGSNHADFDNDGFLDMYLGTGDPKLGTLVPNRMFKNVEGRRFAEITASSRTGHLQKGHAVACGDWDRDGDLDLFEEMGGVVNGDRYHNVLFQNPGQGNHWLTLKLVGCKTNRAATGARIKLVTSETPTRSIHRLVGSGSSFGANPMQQTIGLARADQVALLEVFWPASGTTQVFRSLAVNQAIEVTEFATSYRVLEWPPIMTRN
jgi:hypothetical protein